MDRKKLLKDGKDGKRLDGKDVNKGNLVNFK